MQKYYTYQIKNAIQEFITYLDPPQLQLQYLYLFEIPKNLINLDHDQQITISFRKSYLQIIAIITLNTINPPMLDHILRELAAASPDEIPEIIEKYNSMLEEDMGHIIQIKDELDQVRKILITDINKICERGEKIDELLYKTEILKIDSQSFKKRSKQMNRCCQII